MANPKTAVAAKAVPAPAASAPAAAPAAKKCPITRAQFSEHAQGLTVKIGDNTMIASPKEFSTGSLGFYANGKIVVEIDGVPCSVQVGLNLTLVGSKDV